MMKWWFLNSCICISLTFVWLHFVLLKWDRWWIRRFVNSCKCTCSYLCPLREGSFNTSLLSPLWKRRGFSIGDFNLFTQGCIEPSNLKLATCFWMGKVWKQKETRAEENLAQVSGLAKLRKNHNAEYIQ